MASNTAFLAPTVDLAAPLANWSKTRRESGAKIRTSCPMSRLSRVSPSSLKARENSSAIIRRIDENCIPDRQTRSKWLRSAWVALATGSCQTPLLSIAPEAVSLSIAAGGICGVSKRSPQSPSSIGSARCRGFANHFFV